MAWFPVHDHGALQFHLKLCGTSIGILNVRSIEQNYARMFKALGPPYRRPWRLAGGIPAIDVPQHDVIP